MTTCKTGAEHIKSLKDGRNVYIDGQKVADVTLHPAFRNSVKSAAALYDFQARPENLPAAEAFYQKNRIRAEVQSFFIDVPERLARAHLAICRAGASTVAELAAIGRPALLIPYPHATDDHQTANARAFAETGAGWVVPQSELRADTLALHLEDLLGNPTALSGAAQRAGDFGRPDAAARLAQLAIELGLGSRSQGRAA